MFKVCSEFAQSVFRVCSECFLSVFRVCLESVQSRFRVGSVLVHSVFRVFSEFVQSVSRVCSEYVQSVFRVGSGLLVKIGCQYWLSKFVVKILVIVSSSASSVMFWHFFYKGDSLEIINLLLQSCLTRLLAMVVLDIAKGATNPRCECLCQSCLFKLQTSTIRYKQLQAVIKRFPSLFKLKRQL